MLVVGRTQGLSDFERKRLERRRNSVLVNSRYIQCMTYDELYDDLRFQLEKAAPLTPAPDAPGDLT